MSNLEMIKNKKGAWGIRDLNTRRVIIPCRYQESQLNAILEIKQMGYGIYQLIGNREGKRVYGLYNSFTGYLTDLKYDKITLEQDQYELYTLNDIESYDPRVDTKEILPGIFVTEQTKFINPPVSELIHLSTPLYGENVVSTKTYLSICDTYHDQYIFGDHNYDVEGAIWYERANHINSGYHGYVKPFITNYDSVLILGDQAIYDTTNGYFQDHIHVFSMHHIDDTYKNELFGNNLLLFDDLGFWGYYDLQERKAKPHQKLGDSVTFQKDYSKKVGMGQLYVSDFEPHYLFCADFNGKKGFYPVRHFSHFLKVVAPDFTILWDENFQVISNVSKQVSILKIKQENKKNWGIFGDAIYLVNGRLCHFAKEGKRFPLIKKEVLDQLPFIEMDEKLVAAVEYNYGTGVVAAASEIELDYLLDEVFSQKQEIEQKMQDIYYQYPVLQAEYPTLVRKKKH